MLQDISMKSLQTMIAGDEHLMARVAQVWGVVPTPTLTIKRLMLRMQNPFAARSVWLQLDEAERLCLFQALGTSARSKGIPLDSLRKKVKLPRSTVEAAVSHLREHWMLIDEDEVITNPKGRTLVEPREQPRGMFPFRECSDALWGTGQELFKPHTDRSQMSLVRLLSLFSGSDLEHLARRCHVQTPAAPYYRGYASFSYRSFDLQEQVAEALQQPLIVFEIVRHLDATTQRLFHWLCCERGGQATMTEVRAWLHGSEDQLYEVLRQLEMHAMAFDSLTPKASRLLTVPPEVLAAAKHYLSQLEEDERTYVFLPLAQPPTVIREGQPKVCYDLAVVVGAVHHLILEPTKEQRLPKRQSTKLRPLLHGQPRLADTGDDLYPDMIVAAARQFEIIRLTRPFEDAKLRYVPGPNLTPSWSQSSFVEQIRRFLAWWCHSTEWMDDGIGQGSKASTTGRKPLLEQLRASVPSKWYAVESLLYSVWKAMPLEQNARGYQKPQASGASSLRARWKKWRKAQEERYLGMLASTLFETGMVSLGYARTFDGDPDVYPIAWSLTALGACVLAEGDARCTDKEEAVKGVPSLIVQPSFEVVALRMDPALIYELLAFADMLWIEQVSRFKITKASLLHGLSTGRRIEDILVFLHTHSQVEVAQNVERTLLDWSQDYQEAFLSEMMLIDLSGEQVARAVQRALEARLVPYRRLSPCTLAVPLHTISRSDLYKLLEKTGAVVREKTTSDV